MRSQLLRRVPMLVVFATMQLGLNAQFQRMGIARGTVSLAPNAAGEVSTYCLDFTRESPHPNVAYNNVLTSGDSARVSINGHTMTLQAAIAANKVRIRGAQVTLSELINAMNNTSRPYPPEERQRIQHLASLWASLSAQDRAAVEREYQPRLAALGDHEHLQLENLTPFPMTVSFDGAILGAQDEGLPAVALNSIRPASSPDEQRKLQDLQWQVTTKHSQALLKAAHAYAGPLDGHPSPQFQEAVRRFQQSHSLEVTGKIDANTDSLLQGTVDQQWASHKNASSAYSKLATITIKRNPNSQNRYSVFTSAMTPDYEGNDIRQIAKTLRVPLNATTGTLYLNLDGFSDANREDFASSIRIQRDLLGDDFMVALIPRRSNGDIDTSYFDPGIRIEKVSQIEEIATGPNRGWFETTINVAIRVVRSGVETIRRVTITLASSSREALLAAATMLKNDQAALAFDDQRSLADVVAMTRGKIKKLHPELKGQDLRIQFRNEVGLSQWVLLWDAAPLIAAAA